LRSTYSHYKEIALKHPRLPLKEERKLISLAKKGDLSARKKLILHLTGFFIFRIETTLYRQQIRQCGEDILQECILLAINKIQRFKLRYKNKKGDPAHYHFSTYLWKGVTGVMFVCVRRNSREVSVSDFWGYC